MYLPFFFPKGAVSTTPSCTTAPMATLTQLLAQPQPVAMPQFIMTSGQLVQGIQGAQLFIPTSQGKYTIIYDTKMILKLYSTSFNKYYTKLNEITNHKR